jgi:hypothetical protein
MPPAAIDDREAVAVGNPVGPDRVVGTSPEGATDVSAASDGVQNVSDAERAWATGPAAAGRVDVGAADAARWAAGSAPAAPARPTSA